MLASVMQDAIKAKAASRTKKEFKDPYVKPKMSKEDFLAEKSRGIPASPSGGASGSVDLSPLIQSQNQMQRQLQQLAESMKGIRVGGHGEGNPSHNSSTTSGMTKEDMTAQLDAFRREIRQSTRQANDDLLSQVESIVRDAVKDGTAGSSSSASSGVSNAEVSRLRREVTQLKNEVAELKEENEKLRQRPTPTSSPAATPKATSSWRSPSTKSPSYSGSRSTTSPAPASSSSAASTGEMHVKETYSRYELSLDIPGVKVSDLKISYGGGALELEAKGKKYSFEVAQSKIDASGISATLQASGTLQITVPKKK